MNGVARYGWSARLRTRLTTAIENSDDRALVPLLILTVFYTFIASLLAMRPLWYDELITYYIAKSPTLVANVDLNPPLQAWAKCAGVT